VLTWGPAPPRRPARGPVPSPTALAHIPQKHQRLSRSADFVSGKDTKETATHTRDEHNPRQTQRGPHAALPPQKKARKRYGGAASQ